MGPKKERGRNMGTHAMKMWEILFVRMLNDYYIWGPTNVGRIWISDNPTWNCHLYLLPLPLPVTCVIHPPPLGPNPIFFFCWIFLHQYCPKAIEFIFLINMVYNWELSQIFKIHLIILWWWENYCWYIRFLLITK